MDVAPPLKNHRKTTHFNDDLFPFRVQIGTDTGTAANGRQTEIRFVEMEVLGIA